MTARRKSRQSHYCANTACILQEASRIKYRTVFTTIFTYDGIVNADTDRVLLNEAVLRYAEKPAVSFNSAVVKLVAFMESIRVGVAPVPAGAQRHEVAVVEALFGPLDQSRRGVEPVG